jgi:hypothetical protein
MTVGLESFTSMTVDGCAPCAESLASAPQAPPAAPSQKPSAAYWAGAIGVEGELTGDGRFIEPNALVWDLPMPLRYVSSDVGEHGGAVVAGRILTATRQGDGSIWATGDFDMGSPDGVEAERQVRERLTNGVSMDLDDVSFEVRVAAELLVDPAVELTTAPPVPGPDGKITVATIKSGDEVRATTSARIRAATIVAIPAFADAQIFSTDTAPVVDGAQTPAAELPTDGLPSYAAGIDGELPDGTACSTDPQSPDYDPGCVAVPPGEPADDVTDDDITASAYAGKPGSAAHLIAWYLTGEGAAKIRWGTPGDFARCVRIADNHMAKELAKGFCANRHHDATGEWPGKGSQHSAIVSSAAPMSPPSAWFSAPSLSAPTALTVTDDGRVFGHLATWNTCHIGMGHAGCITPPHSRAGYAYFRTGTVVTAENAEVPVGHITLDTRHASTSGLSAAGAQAHYENTGSVVADVAAGEDSFGIWIAGALRPGVSASQVRELRASPLSGDWRRVSGNLELVAALAVNVPGFPIPRPAGLVAGGVVQSLVASGMVPPRQVLTPGTDGALSMDDLTYLKRLADRERAEEQALLAAGSLPSATDLARRVRASALSARAHR